MMDGNIESGGSTYHQQTVYVSVPSNEICGADSGTSGGSSQTLQSLTSSQDACLLIVEARSVQAGQQDMAHSTLNTGMLKDYAAAELILSDSISEGDSVYIVDMDGTLQPVSVHQQMANQQQADVPCDASADMSCDVSHDVSCDVTTDVSPDVDVSSALKVQCEVCRRTFANKSNLRRHMHMHTGIRPYVCTVCKQSFRQNSHLKDHMRLHSGARPFTCAVCNKAFRNASALTIHMRTHTGERPYACTECKCKFVCRTHLVVHQRRHTGEKPFSCETCQKSFSRSDSLAIHERIHTNKRAHACDKCPRTFGRLSRLLAHIRKMHDVEHVLNELSNTRRHVIKCDSVFRRNMCQKRYRCRVCDTRFHSAYTLVCHQHVRQMMANQCFTCSLHFNTKRSLTLHALSHSQNIIHRCYICKLRSRSAFVNKLHVESHQENRLACETCDVRCDSIAAMLRHRGMHSRTRMQKCYACQRCGKRFWYTSSLQVHRCLVVGVVSVKFMCVPCKAGFDTTHELKIHSRMMQCGKYSDKPVQKMQLSAVSIQAEPVIKEEKEVDAQFTQQVVETFQQITTPTTFIQLIGPNEIKVLIPYDQQDVDMLPESVNAFSQPNSFTCFKCGNSYESRAQLAQHQYEMHPKQVKASKSRQYQCAECNRTFCTRTQLAYHMHTHTGLRPYKCAQCGRQFSHSSNLNRHSRTHTGERPFTCKTCDKSFTQNSHLSDHQRTHTGARPYTCEVCSRALANQTALRNHMRTHSGERPYKCLKCGRDFACQTHLKTHDKRHTGEKPHVCSCGKSFARKDTLAVHQLTHCSTYSFVCCDCNQTFKTKSCLAKHHKQMHAAMHESQSSGNTSQLS